MKNSYLRVRVCLALFCLCLFQAKQLMTNKCMISFEISHVLRMNKANLASRIKPALRRARMCHRDFLQKVNGKTMQNLPEKNQNKQYYLFSLFQLYTEIRKFFSLRIVLVNLNWNYY
ncbi:unnamed protein product [Brassica rapa subsp. narinosa]